MYWLLLPPSANTQRHLEAPGMPLSVVWQRLRAALRGGCDTLRRFFR